MQTCTVMNIIEPTFRCSPLYILIKLACNMTVVTDNTHAAGEGTRKDVEDKDIPIGFVGYNKVGSYMLPGRGRACFRSIQTYNCIGVFTLYLHFQDYGKSGTMTILGFVLRDRPN